MASAKTTLFWEVTEVVNGANKVASGSSTVDGDKNHALAHWNVYFAPHGYRLLRIAAAT